MKAIASFFVRRRWLLVAIPILASMFLLVSVSDSGESATFGSILFLAVAAVALTVLALNLAGYDPDADQVATDLVASPSGQALVGRWLRRSRYYRFVGGAMGFVLGFGFVANGMLIPIVVGLLGGVAAGGALAEIHILRVQQSSTRAADLTSRRVADYVKPLEIWAVGGVAVAAVLATTAAQAISTADRSSATRWGVAALATVAITGLLHRLVVTRTRPALPVELRAADDLLRYLAATQGFTRPALALAFGMLAQSVNGLGAADGYSIAAVVLWLLGLAWYLSSRQDRAHLVGMSKT